MTKESAAREAEMPRSKAIQFGQENASCFGEFWPYYLQMHSASKTRFAHALGTTVGALVFVACIKILWPHLLLLSVPTGFLAALLATYAFAIPSHGVFEKNRAATLEALAKDRAQGTKELLWSILGDLKMTFLLVCGRLEREIDRLGIERDYKH